MLQQRTTNSIRELMDSPRSCCILEGAGVMDELYVERVGCVLNGENVQARLTVNSLLVEVALL